MGQSEAARPVITYHLNYAEWWDEDEEGQPRPGWDSRSLGTAEGEADMLTAFHLWTWWLEQEGMTGEIRVFEHGTDEEGHFTMEEVVMVEMFVEPTLQT